MREFFQAINDYPWTTFIVFAMLIVIVNEIGQGRKKKE